MADGFGDVRQLGYVVRDLGAAVETWTRQLGVGPWTIIRNITLESVYRGAPSRPLIDIALGYRGEMQIELIEQRNDAPSPYTEFLAGGREGLQHLGFWVHDHAEATRVVEGAGYKPVYEIRVAGQDLPIVYYDSPALYGPMLELVPPKWRRSREAIRKMTGEWIGSDPVIRYDTYVEFLADAGVRFD
jgi:hypothetical protein